MNDTKFTSTGRVPVNAKNEKQLLGELVELLKRPRRYNELNEAIKLFGERRNLTDSGRRRLESKLSTTGALKEIPLRWSANAPAPKPRLFSTQPPEDITALEIATALHRKSYLCYHTALFWNQLTEQIPNTFYIAVERPSTSGPKYRQRTESLDDFVLRDVFVKNHIEHTNVATFRQSRFVIIARSYSGNAGMVHRTVHFQGKATEIALTGAERTLIDCIASPEDAGGIATVVDAMKLYAPSIDIERFAALYEDLAFKYPHWQRIGLLLDKLGYIDLAKYWKSKFCEPKNKFFLARGYRLEWKFDEKWSIYYPPGLLA